MNSGPDYFSWRMLEDWLSRYISLRVRAPQTVDAMRSRQGEFEMIPVPKALVDQLSVEAGGADITTLAGLGFGPKGGGGGGGASDVGGLFGGGAWDPVVFAERFAAMRSSAADSVAAAEKARHAEAIGAIVRHLAAAVEKGDQAAIGKLLAEDYRDASGRTAGQLLEAVERFFKVSAGRRVVLTRAEQFEVIGPAFVAVIAGAWQADITGAEGTRTLADSFRLEVVFERGPEGRWKIAGVRHV